MRTLIPAIGLALMAACDQPMEPRVYERMPGILETVNHEGTLDPVVIEMPSEVSAGEGFTLSIRTYGDGCVEFGDEQLVDVQGLSARVVPLDDFVTYLPPGQVCSEELRIFTHVATLRFDEPGEARIIVEGRRTGADGARAPMSVEFDVQVR